MFQGPRLSLTVLTVAALQACGGGGSDSATAAAPGGGVIAPAGVVAQSAMSVTGMVVVQQAVGGATVCVDLNANLACDASDPTGAKTGVDGVYTITFQPADAAATTAFGSATVLALLGTDSVDAADGAPGVGANPYYLAAPVSKPAQLNPLTTLVQVGVRAGMSLPTAEAAVAQQLAVDPTRIYSYLSDGALAAGVAVHNTTFVAKIVAEAFANGAAINLAQVTDAATPTVSQIALLNYADAQNFSLRMRQSTGIPDASDQTSTFETRTTISGGVSVAHDSLYPVFLGPTGWVRCDETVPLLLSRGNPYNFSYCGGARPSINYTTSTVDVSGQSMAAVISTMQGAAGSTITLTPSILGAATFPAGSTIRTFKQVNLAQPWFINSPGSDGFSSATLEAFIAGRPAASVNLTTSAGSVFVGVFDLTHSTRAAFIDATTAQLYKCEATAPNYSDSHNCVTLSTTPFVIDTVSGARVLTYSTPLAGTSSTVRAHAEFGGRVYAVRRETPDLGTATTLTQRLSNEASNALRVALNLLAA